MPGANLAQEARCPAVGESGHVHADLRDDDGGRGGPDARDLIQPRGRLGETGHVCLDLLIDGGNVGVDRVDAAEHPREQEPVIGVEVPGERLLELADLRAHA